jgi:hypothetical protein
VHRRVDAEERQIKSDFPQHLVDESDFNSLNMHLLNHFSDHTHPLRSILYESSEHPEQERVDPKEAYRPSNRDEAAFHIVQRNYEKKCFTIRSGMPSIQNNVMTMICL